MVHWSYLLLALLPAAIIAQENDNNDDNNDDNNAVSATVATVPTAATPTPAPAATNVNNDNDDDNDDDNIPVSTTFATVPTASAAPTAAPVPIDDDNDDDDDGVNDTDDNDDDNDGINDDDDDDDRVPVAPVATGAPMTSIATVAVPSTTASSPPVQFTGAAVHGKDVSGMAAAVVAAGGVWAYALL